MSLLDNLPHRCNIYRRKRSREPGGVGTSVDSLHLIQSNVECWEQQMSATETNMWQKRGITVSKKVYFVADPQLSEGCMIAITHRNGVDVPASSATKLDVMSRPEPDSSAGLGVLWSAVCKYQTGSA